MTATPETTLPPPTIEALAAALRLARCPVDYREFVGECVDSKHCGCSCGLLLRDGL